MMEHPCEGPEHYPFDLYESGIELAPSVLPPVEGKDLHIYNDEDHFFCSEKCWRKWWFDKQREEGHDVNKIPLTSDGEAWSCGRCYRAILFEDIENVYVFQPRGAQGQTIKFCCAEHYESFVEEFYNGRENRDSEGAEGRGESGSGSGTSDE